MLDCDGVATHAGTAPERILAAQRVLERQSIWYHTLELAPGVLTPGQIDLRGVARKLLPADLSGLRALDVGTFDGFWAFELERRGADVVAIDVEQLEAAQWPPNQRDRLEQVARAYDLRLGRGFELAAEVLQSRVERVVCDVLELTPEAVGGAVDVAFMGALLIHLRDPVLALERVRETLSPGGALYQLEAFSPLLTMLHPRRPVAALQTLQTQFNWWFPNWSAQKALLRTAGFGTIRGRGVYRPPQRAPMGDWYRGLVSRRP